MTEYAFLIEQFPYPGLFVVLILGSLGLPVPEDVILLFCGYLIFKSAINPVPALLVAYTGVVASDFIIFFIGRRYGRHIVTHRRFQRLLSTERLTALEIGFARYGGSLIFFGRHLWGFRAKIFLAAGVLGIPWRKFLLVDALAALVTVPLMTAVGYAGGRGLQAFRPDALRNEYLIIALTALLALVLIAWKLGLRRRREDD